MHSKSISGFSKFSKSEKIEWLKANFLNEYGESDVLTIFQQNDVDLQKVIDGFSENTISNFVLPYGLAPNFLIDGNLYCVPMVIEESSVVAAASAGAKAHLLC